MTAPVSTLKRILSTVVPEAALLVATVLLLTLPATKSSLPDFARFYPYAVYCVGALIAVRFRRSRLLFAMLLLALVTWGLSLAGGTDSAARVVFQAVALLLPVNLALVALIADRGILTPLGLARLAVIGLEVLLVDLFRRTAAPATAALLSRGVIPARLMTWTPLAQPALLAFLAAAVLIVLFTASSTRRSFLWALAASLLALHAHRPGPGAAIYFGTTALILVVAVIEASYLLAYQDGLTELPARRALGEAMLRLSGQYTVAMVDVDHFKQFNDQYGHDVGDQVLRMVAAKLATVAGGGRAYRYGGEEFAILFPGKSVDDAVPHLEAVRQTVADSTFTIRRRLRPRRKPDAPAHSRRRSKQVSITVSIGVAATSSRHTTPDHVIRAADHALYTAKEDGRNRVRTANGKAAVR